MIEGLFLWITLSIIVGVAANTRSRAAGAWFLLSMIISPLLAGLLLLALPKRDDAGPIRISKTERDRG